MEHLVLAQTRSKTRAPPVSQVTGEVPDERPSHRPQSPDHAAADDPQELINLQEGTGETSGAPTDPAFCRTYCDNLMRVSRAPGAQEPALCPPSRGPVRENANRQGRIGKDLRTKRSTKARAAHVESLARARTRSQTRAASLTLTRGRAPLGLLHSQPKPTPSVLGNDDPEWDDQLGDFGETPRTPTGLALRTVPDGQVLQARKRNEKSESGRLENSQGRTGGMEWLVTQGIHISIRTVRTRRSGRISALLKSSALA